MRNWGYQTFHDEDAVQSAYRNVTEAIVTMVAVDEEFQPIPISHRGSVEPTPR